MQRLLVMLVNKLHEHLGFVKSDNSHNSMDACLRSSQVVSSPLVYEINLRWINIEQLPMKWTQDVEWKSNKLPRMRDGITRIEWDRQSGNNSNRWAYKTLIKANHASNLVGANEPASFTGRLKHRHRNCNVNQRIDDKQEKKKTLSQLQTC